ncbi:YARHG domain-containing protein [Mediterraneibacter agrestimuris]|uniref:YARHG domain-containing protein n=1 Tax=Mediterraneibacter agrestimuris TaxID=2941333 RepID=UPI0020409DC2|nr:YARHG domain-containing protein [Mediterraneibacter agrestimuris]
MKCQYCSNEIPDDSLFCPECGQQLNVTKQEQEVCAACGTPLEDGAIFCSECGTPCRQETVQTESAPNIPEYNNVNRESGNNRDREPDKKSKAPVIIIIVLCIVIFAGILMGAAMMLKKKGDDTQKNPPEQEEVLEEEPDSSDEVDFSDVDFNLLEDDRLFMEGLIKKSESGSCALQWDEALTFYGEDFDGTKILLEDAHNAYIDKAALPEGLLDSIKSNQVVYIAGQLYFDNEKLYITPFEILDKDDNDLIAKFEETKEKEKEQETKQEKEQEKVVSNSDYILPQSDARLLTSSDISGLDIRELNYAKNEIYARHGRLFQSPELQNYFNSKSWYHGTVSPESFSNSLLSSIEQKNAEFLSNAEFSMNPKGYQLDAD